MDECGGAFQWRILRLLAATAKSFGLFLAPPRPPWQTKVSKLKPSPRKWSSRFTENSRIFPLNDSPRSWSTSLRWQLTSCRTALVDCTAGPTATRCHQMPSGSFWPERGWRGPWRCIAVRPRDLLPAGSQHRLDTLRPHLEGVDGVEDTAAFLSQLLELGLQWATAYKNIVFLAAEWLLNAHSFSVLVAHSCTLHCLCSQKFWG